jgi:hypothetical protein
MLIPREGWNVCYCARTCCKESVEAVTGRSRNEGHNSTRTFGPPRFQGGRQVQSEGKREKSAKIALKERDPGQLQSVGPSTLHAHSEYPACQKYRSLRSECLAYGWWTGWKRPPEVHAVSHRIQTTRARSRGLSTTIHVGSPNDHLFMLCTVSTTFCSNCC